MSRSRPRTAGAGFFDGRPFAGFGPSRLEGGSARPPYQVAGERPGRLRVAIRAECPRRPGVYGMVDGDGELIYVGKAKCLRTRLLSYFRAHSRDPKAGRILRRTQAIAWETVDSEFAALLRELELIRRWRPRFNVQGQPGRFGRTFVCLGRSPAPYVFLTVRPPARAIAVFGPVPAGRRAREAVRYCNDCFGLRDCPQAQEMIFADQAELFTVPRAAGCIRYEIGTCLGPCAAACSQSRYSRQVRSARAFLEGKTSAPLEVLEQQMQAASAALAFERAAALRDQLDLMRWLRQRLEWIRQAQGPPCLIYPVTNQNGIQAWYLICHGRVEAVLPAPCDADAARAAAARIRGILKRGLKAMRNASPQDMPAILLVAAWFRRKPQERERLLQPPAALALCRKAMRS